MLQAIVVPAQAASDPAREQELALIHAAEADFATQRDVGRRKRDIRTLLLKVRLDNPKGAWVPGMTAEVLVPAAQAK